MSTGRRLLVAVPAMVDPNFFRAVVFMVEHNQDGALGLVLNRPSDTDLGEVLPQWRAVASEPAVAFVGGPVQRQDAVIGLARVSRVDASDAWQPLLGRVGTVDLGLDPDHVHPRVEAIRVFAGYAGWGPDQLEQELAQGGWFVVDAEPDDLLTAEPDGLWRQVLRRQGGDLAMAANHPFDPTTN